MSRNLAAALACLALILAITFLSASGIGFDRQVETVASLPADRMVRVLEEGMDPRPGEWVPVQAFTFLNRYIPRQSLLPQVTACLYNSSSGQGAYLTTRWTPSDSLLAYRELLPEGNIVRLGLGITRVTLEVQPWTIYRGTQYVTPVQGEPRPAKPVPGVAEPERYDTLYLFMQEIRGFRDHAYTPCENLQPGDLARAARIPLTG
jgi:hypothetical protein